MSRLSLPTGQWPVLIVFMATFACLIPMSPASGQWPPTGERHSVVLPGDPFRWEQTLNELGQRGWDALMAQQPAAGNLTLHIVLMVRNPAVKSVDYKVVVAEFPATADPYLVESTRLQLEVQANAHAKNGWYLLQALTGTHGTGKAFIALIHKKLLP
jgi:hypothetical protein